jgi:GT2 family glycosyltransferase
VRFIFADRDEAAAVAATQAGLTVAVAPAGRAQQQNAGAFASQRPWLWFLHADSRPDAEVFCALRRFVAHGTPALGWFRLRFGAQSAPGIEPRLLRRMRLNAAGANWRSRRLGLPFGDQGLVLPAGAFERLGGFDTRLAYGEDFALVCRARRQGLPLRELPAYLDTSARKYAERGWWRTTARHLGLTATLAWQEWRR